MESGFKDLAQRFSEINSGSIFSKVDHGRLEGTLSGALKFVIGRENYTQSNKFVALNATGFSDRLSCKFHCLQEKFESSQSVHGAATSAQRYTREYEAMLNEIWNEKESITIFYAYVR